LAHGANEGNPSVAIDHSYGMILCKVRCPSSAIDGLRTSAHPM